MDIEKLILIKTVKAGQKVYLKGEEHSSPGIDEVLLNEVRIGAGTVKVLKWKKFIEPPLKLIKKKLVEEDDTTSTLVGLTSNLIDEPEEEQIVPPEPKGKTKLVKRKGK